MFKTKSEMRNHIQRIEETRHRAHVLDGQEEGSTDIYLCKKKSVASATRRRRTKRCRGEEGQRSDFGLGFVNMREF